MWGGGDLDAARAVDRIPLWPPLTPSHSISPVRRLRRLRRLRPRAAAIALTLGAAGCVLSSDQGPFPAPLAPGQALAYVSQGASNRDDIFLLSADAKQDTNLTNSITYDSWPAWSPDGVRMAFESDRANQRTTEVYVLSLNGVTPLARLTNDSTHQSAQPAWSPLGNRIAFVSGDTAAGFDIYLMDPDGKNRTRLTTGARNNVEPSWKPDGSRLAFASDRTGNAEIFVMDTSGANAVNVTNNSLSDLAPAWSPDGQKIAFMSNRSVDFAVWVMNPDGSNPTRISSSVPPCELPQWTKDGKRLGFDCGADIYLANADGTGLTRITRTEERQRSEVMVRWRP